LGGADEVVLRAWEGGDGREFFGELLDAVLAEETLASGVGFEDDFDGVHLANGHEGDLGGRAGGAAAGEVDLLVEAGEVVGDGHSASSYGRGWVVCPTGGGGSMRLDFHFDRVPGGSILAFSPPGPWFERCRISEFAF
jgi:hypothetical protein